MCGTVICEQTGWDNVGLEQVVLLEQESPAGKLAAALVAESTTNSNKVRNDGSTSHLPGNCFGKAESRNQSYLSGD